MGNSNRLLLVHRHMEPVSPDKAVDIMLTPQFYTMKKEKLPLRYAYQARKIAPSLFDGLLEDAKNYDYFVYKEDTDWVFIAYNPDEIIRFLLQKGIGPEKVGKVFFVQQAKEHITAPLALGDKEAVTVLDETVVVVPRQVLGGGEYIPFDEHFRPDKGLRLETGIRVLLTKKQAIVVAVVLLLFGMIWMAEGIRYGKTNTVFKKELDRLYESYPALQSAYARENIAGKYRKIDRAERRKREIVGKIAGLIFKGVTLTDFTLNREGFRAHFMLQDKAVATRFTALLQSAGFKKYTRSGEHEITVEGKL